MPEIETERLRLRHFKPDDIEAMWPVWSSPQVMRFIHPNGWPFTRAETEASLSRIIKYFEEHDFGQWGIEHKAEGKLIGYCGLKYLPETPDVEVLYGVAPEYWNQGYVTEAARAALRYGFEEAGLDKIVAIAAPGNVGSWRVMEKIGMRREGLASHREMEVVRYTISREDFEPDDSTYILRRRA